MIPIKSQGKVSVIVPVFNMSAYIRRCVYSIIEQEYRDLEIILVDDGSTDDSYIICKELSLLDGRIKCVHKKNGGQGSARNMGLDICTGDYILFVDSDDYIETNCVSLLMNNLIRYNADISCGRMYQNANKIDFCKGQNIEVFDNVEAMNLYVRNWKGIDQAPVAKLFKKSLFLDVRFLEISGYEDAGTMFKPFSKADKVVAQDISLYYYFQREGSTMHREFSKKDCDRIVAYREMEKYLHGDIRYTVAANYATSSKLGAIYYVLGETLKKNLPEKKEIVSMCKQECQETIKKGYQVSIKNRILIQIIVGWPQLFGLLYKFNH